MENASQTTTGKESVAYQEPALRHKINWPALCYSLQEGMSLLDKGSMKLMKWAQDAEDKCYSQAHSVPWASMKGEGRCRKQLISPL